MRIAPRTKTGGSGQDGGRDSSIRDPVPSEVPSKNRDPKQWRREVKQQRSVPPHPQEGLGPVAALIQTVKYFSNARVYYHSDLVHDLPIARGRGRSPPIER